MINSSYHYCPREEEQVTGGGEKCIKEVCSFGFVLMHTHVCVCVHMIRHLQFYLVKELEEYSKDCLLLYMHK